MIRPGQKRVQICVMLADGRLAWGAEFMALIGYNRAMARRFAAAMLFGFHGETAGRQRFVGKQSSETYTPNLPGSIDVSEDEAIDTSRFTKTQNETSTGLWKKQWWHPILPVEFFRDMRRSVLCSALIPVETVIQWRDDLGFTMYQDYASLKEESQIIENKRKAKVLLYDQRKRMAEARGIQKKQKRRAQKEKTYEYGEQLKAMHRERTEASKRRRAAAKIKAQKDA